jgi:hypothetical protein
VIRFMDISRRSLEHRCGVYGLFRLGHSWRGR